MDRRRTLGRTTVILRLAPRCTSAAQGPHQQARDENNRRGNHPRVAQYRTDRAEGSRGAAAAVLTRAAQYFADHGITRIERVISDNAFAYRKSHAFKDAVAALGAVQKFIKPHCPWTNGKVERLNCTLATKWAYRQTCASSTHRSQALAPWLEFYNTERIHTGIGTTPLKRMSPT